MEKGALGTRPGQSPADLWIGSTVGKWLQVALRAGICEQLNRFLLLTSKLFNNAEASFRENENLEILKITALIKLMKENARQML